jgi:hypothetical protein
MNHNNKTQKNLFVPSSSFADLVTIEFNSEHHERVREGKAAQPEDMGEWLMAFCRAFDKYGVHPPGRSGLASETMATGKMGSLRKSIRFDPPELETPDLAELGIVP